MPANNLRFACRLVLRQPLWAAAAILAIAFGIGANTAISSVLESILLNPAGLPHAGGVAVARVTLDRIQLHKVPTSGVEFREIQSMTDAFSSVAAEEGREWTAQIAGQPARLTGQAVTPDFFRVFAVRPALGRFFSAEDRQTAVLSYSLWQSQFGADPSVLGRAILLDGLPYRIAGVAPPDFRFPPTAQAWVPLILEPARLQRRGWNMTLTVFAHLQNGVSLDRAAARVSRYVAALVSAPENRYLARLGFHIDIDPLATYVAGDLGKPLWLLFAAALVVLLTACANVAGLLLARSAGRRREIAIRIALGATRAQILRQLLTESLLLAILGGVAGLLLAANAVPLIARLVLPGGQWLALVALDRRILVFGFALSLASGLLFGLAPALELLRSSHTASLARARRLWHQDIFVTAQVAGALVLSVMIFLLLRSLWAVERIQPGFDAGHLTTAFLMKPHNDPGFQSRLRAALNTAPGVESAALAYPLPFSAHPLGPTHFGIRNRQTQPGEPWRAEPYQISPEFLRTLRIPLLRGRNLDDRDTASSPPVCLIDSRLAERFFSNEDPLGHEIGLYGGWARIVGVVGAIRANTLDDDSLPAVYYSFTQIPFWPPAGIVVRSKASAGAIIRDAVRRANSSVPVYDIRSMDDRIAESLGVRRVLALLLVAFGAVALLLAAFGVYGVIAQVVAERTSEIGIRMALGARPAQIFAHFARRGLRAGILGIACGLAAAAVAQRWIAALLYQVRPFDLAAFAGAAAALLVLLLLAVWHPARRAALTDPQQALHHE